MARKQKARPEVTDQGVFLEGVAKNLADKLYGPSGPPPGTTFAELEEVAVQLGQAISREILNRSLARQAESTTETVCPTCRGASTAGEPEPRTLTTRAGEVDWNEPRRHCPKCRRSFFPSVAGPRDRPVGGVTGGANDGGDGGDGDGVRSGE
jgi:hypothetical protein